MDIRQASQPRAAGVGLINTRRPEISEDEIVILHPAPAHGARAQYPATNLPAGAPGVAERQVHPTASVGMAARWKNLVNRAAVWLTQTFSWSWHQTNSSPHAQAMARRALSTEDRAAFRESNLEALKQDLVLTARDLAERQGDTRVWELLNGRGSVAYTDRGSADPAQSRRTERARRMELDALAESVVAWAASDDALESGNLSTRQGREATRLAMAVLKLMADAPEIQALNVTTLLNGIDRKAKDPNRAVRVAALMALEPGLSLQRAGLLVDFAASQPRHTIGVARALCRPPAARIGFDHRGVAAGSNFDETLVPDDFQPHHMSRVVSNGEDLALEGASEASPHHIILQNFSTAKVPRTVRLTSGDRLVLNQALIEDCERAVFVVNEQLMPRGNRQSFLDAYRAQFPAGSKGDALASLVSDCANQFSAHPVHVFIADRTFGPAYRTDSIVYETWQDKDGDWTVRCSMLIRFPLATVGVGPDASAPFDMAKGSATLQTVTFRIQPDPFDEAPPRVMSIESEVVFTGGPASAAPQVS